jgi:ABC-type phosphate transport system substrate-binding protein
MRKSARKLTKCLVQLILGFILALFGVQVSAATSNVGYVSANRLALKAYCSEAHDESALLANGSTSYENVIRRASARAMLNYPNVCSDISAWKTKISAILDQYGDEPLPELCREDPDQVGSAK